MALFYNADGTITEVIVNYIDSGSGAITSILTAPTIQQAFEASASKAIYENAINALSSSAQAYNLAYPTDKSDWTLINSVLTSPKNQ